jgi:hypothetical protein
MEGKVKGVVEREGGNRGEDLGSKEGLDGERGGRWSERRKMERGGGDRGEGRSRAW